MTHTPTAGSIEERIQRVEHGLIPEPTLRNQEFSTAALADRMAINSVPGLSVAVIDAYQIAWARGYGVREAGKAGEVTAQTLFQAASISKPVTAAAVLRLVEQGRLDLDEDINAYLASWKLPANGPWQPRVTLRHLLCHGGGTTVHGFPGYRRDEALPAVRQVLDGEPPANTPAIRVNALPGTQMRYSGGGTTIVQQLLVDVTGTPFPDLMRELVLGPLGMHDSGYQQPLPESRRPSAASGHRSRGGVVEGQWHVYPEMAAAGLWTTPSDLARFAIEIQLARAGTPERLLSKATVEQMLTPQVEEQIGIGFFLDGKGTLLRFSHSGGNEGFRCLLLAYAERGQGAVVMTNADDGWILLEEIFRAIAIEYGWPVADEHTWLNYLAPKQPWAKADPRSYTAYLGTYELNPGFEIAITVEADGLLMRPTGQPAVALYPQSEDRFFAKAVDAEIAFVKGDDGQVSELTLKQNGRDMAAKKRG
jgi:CubicO group peptidase (beta-lactamase class C family)